MSKIHLDLAPVVAAILLALGSPSGSAAQAARPNPWLENSPLSASFQMARAISTGQLEPLSGNKAIQPPALKCNPRPCALPNVRASKGPQPVVQTPMALDPNGGNLLTAGTDFNCVTKQGYYLSISGGASWTHSCGNLPAGASSGNGQPIVAWDQNEVAYRGGVDMVFQSAEVVVDKSTDFGVDWSTPVVAARVAGTSMDKPWMEADTNLASPFVNTLYVSATEIANTTKNSRIVVSHSTNGGASWALFNVDSVQIYPNVDQFSDLAIGDDGTVYLTWMRCTANGSTGTCAGTSASMWISKSTDQGNTWSTPAKINTVNLAPDNGCGAFYGCLPNTEEPVSNVPAVAIDNSASPTHGNLYVVDYSWRGFYMRTQVTVSTDGGGSWGSPVRVTPSSDTHDQFFGWISVANNGVVGVTFLDRRNDAANINYDAFTAYSKNGGTSYTDLQLSSASSNPSDDGFGGTFLGDSTGAAWGSGAKHLFASWPDTRTGTSSQDEVGGLMP
jgi:hypothetical protein